MVKVWPLPLWPQNPVKTIKGSMSLNNFTVGVMLPWCQLQHYKTYCRSDSSLPLPLPPFQMCQCPTIPELTIAKCIYSC